MTDTMTNINGHMTGLYDLVADYKVDTIQVFSDILDIQTVDIRVTLRRTDISAQVIVNSTDVKRKCGTKIVFIVNRLDEYETHESIQGVINLLQSLIKIKARRKKITKLQRTYDNKI
jgi:hypothetical protein